jgi:hypothetical protein
VLPFILTFKIGSELSEKEKANRLNFGLSYSSYIAPIIFSFIIIPIINTQLFSSDMENIKCLKEFYNYY